MNNVYTIKQVAEMLDIPSVTLRAWENRYQAVTPERTESGYRLYSPENVEDLRWLKEKTEKDGIGISHAVRLLHARRQDMLEAGGGQGAPGQGYDKMRDQIYEALHAFQGERANALIDFGFSVYSYETMFYQVLVPVLHKVGDAWEAGEATVAQEHYMTHMIFQRFQQFMQAFPVYAHLPRALAFCPAGEHHQVGLLLFSLFLRKNGMDVIYLGANTPEDGVFRLLEEESRIGAVCLSVTDTDLVPYADELVERIKEARPELKIVLGGKGYERSTDTVQSRYVMNEPAERWQEWFDQFF